MKGTPRHPGSSSSFCSFHLAVWEYYRAGQIHAWNCGIVKSWIACISYMIHRRAIYILLLLFLFLLLLLYELCVCTMWIDVKHLSIIAGGQRDLQSWPLPTKFPRSAGWSGKRTCLYIYIDILIYWYIYIYIYWYIVPPLGAYKSQRGDLYLIAVVLYCQWLLCFYFFT